VPGEGKTFSAVNLAMSIAMELDRTVLLVDADVARPSLPHVLGLPETRGLLDRLENPRLPLHEILFRTNVKKLTFLPSGRPNPRATEMLASDAMTALIEELGNRYSDRIILFDSPPLLVTTESRELAQHMGQIVFVIGAGATPVADVQRAVATIESCPVKLTLLNKATDRTPSGDGYGYGYGYGYGR
jgi:exopolysaccharide/PEP-CTERM locus tyrosine autokinase